MAKIQDEDRNYYRLRKYVDFMFRAAYRKVEYYGQEKIPQDGTIIYAPNHTNTLMDALAVLIVDKPAKVFVARADIFKQPAILKFLTFLKMLPINRKRDGVEHLLAQNEEINDIVVDVLRDRVPFCIFPEGTHGHKHGLMSLQKGIFRIALQANTAFGSEMPVYIVPVGIMYGHLFRFRTSLLLRVGDPINVTQFISERAELNIPQQINMLRDELSNQMKKAILQIPDDDNYDAVLGLVQIYNNDEQRKLKLKGNSLIDRFLAAEETIKNIGTSLQTNPQETQQLLDKAGEFSRQRHTLGIGTASVLNPHIRLSLAGKLFLLLLGLPYFAFAAVVTSPVTLLSVWLCSKFKDPAFHNTVRYLVSFVLLPVLLLLLGVAAFIASPCWVWGLAFVLLFLPSFFFLHEYLRLLRLFVSDVKWLIHRDLRRKFKEIKSVFR
ncbi:MAG: 1-acyl-sn-glycerol-3-phosphate acyltransferase [Lentimicrobiaceae bacterium]|nr:1-acyl-sn-glycerol-3-phosphate acyltransferase [Lentimicrobiaceae bacterium]